MGLSTRRFPTEHLRLMREVGLTKRAVDNLDRPEKTLNDAVAYILALPGLRAFWPMSCVSHLAASRALDLAGQALSLVDNNTPTFYYDNLAPYVEFDGVNQYLSRADGGVGSWADIIGTEAYIDANANGLTFGGWFYIDQGTGADQALIGKFAGAGVNRAYSLVYRNANTDVQFVIAQGAAQSTVDSTSIVSFMQWYFVVGRYIPSAEISIFLNNEEDVNNAGIPAFINDIGADFTIGASAVPGNYLDGRASLCFLCAAQLSDAIILTLFEETRALFGV